MHPDEPDYKELEERIMKKPMPDWVKTLCKVLMFELPKGECIKLMYEINYIIWKDTNKLFKIYIREIITGEYGDKIYTYNNMILVRLVDELRENKLREHERVSWIFFVLYFYHWATKRDQQARQRLKDTLLSAIEKCPVAKTKSENGNAQNAKE